MLAPNTILQQRYRVLRMLGQGGMGAVFEAVDQRFGSHVALKLMTAEGDVMLRAFEREARLLNSLRHAALPVVIDYFAESTGQFLVMQYFPGDDLGKMLTERKGPFPIDVVIGWARKLLDALEYLHSRRPSVIHRDIKPQNLKLTADGDIVLLDFGLAKGETGHLTHTTASVLGYTPFYAALEQIRGLGTDARSDLYSLAATLHHLLTGSVPCDALTRADTILQGQPDPLVPAHLVNPAVPAEIGEVLRRALALRRDERPSSATDMRAQMEAALVGRLGALPPPGSAPILAHVASVDPQYGVQTILDETAHVTATGAAATTRPGVEPAPARQTVANHLPGTVAGRAESAVAANSNRALLGIGIAMVSLAVVIAVAAAGVVMMSGGEPDAPLGVAAVAPAARPAVEPAGRIEIPANVLDVALSGDGSSLVVASASPGVTTWSTGTSARTGELRGGDGPFRSVAHGPSGTIVAGSDDGSIRVWRPDGAAAAVLPGHPGGTFLVRLSPDGTTLVSAGFDKNVALWSVADGVRTASVVAPDGGLVVTADAARGLAAFTASDRSVRIVSIRDGRPVSVHRYEGREISFGAFAPDGSRLALGDRDGRVRLVDTETGGLLSILEGPGPEVGSVAWSPDGLWIAAGFGDGLITVWSAGDGSEVRTVEVLKRFVVALAFSGNGRLLACGDEARSVRLVRF